jgi:hypothetical protein
MDLGSMYAYPISDGSWANGFDASAMDLGSIYAYPIIDGEGGCLFFCTNLCLCHLVMASMERSQTHLIVIFCRFLLLYKKPDTP